MNVAMDIRWSMIVLEGVELIVNGPALCRPARKLIVDHREYCIMDGWRILMLELD